MYRDLNFAERAGWKEIIATAGPGVSISGSSVPAQDRSQELANYSTDLLKSPTGSQCTRQFFERASRRGPERATREDRCGHPDGSLEKSRDAGRIGTAQRDPFEHASQRLY